jgi:uncharacterized lipoprotein YddW (UPF0748 family)
MLYFSILFFLIINIVHVQANNEQTEIILTKYNSDEPVKYYKSNVPVTIPQMPIDYKHQFRGVWVSTVYNLDIKKQDGLDNSAIEAYKQQFISILDTLEEYNMNALIFQVRPSNDAFYKSSLNPWSEFLTGTQGQDPNWDPLEWMIEETHKRQIEFHAWFNPYRVSTKVVDELNTKENILLELDENNFARIHPEYVIVGNDNKLLLNPGIPQVRNFIIDSVDELIENYNVDAIHFDDYFYPYDGLSKDEDQEQFYLYNPNDDSLEEWRRNNITLLIKETKNTLKAHNIHDQKAVQFGISPFGIWANKSNNSLGSNTKGAESYYQQYADTRLWVKEEYVDYIAPQIYWNFEKTVAGYADVVDWWVNTVEGTNVNLYIGHGLYQYNSTSPWEDSNEITNQLLYNQKYSEIKGSIFFRYSHLINSDNNNLLIAREVIKSDFWDEDVFLPATSNVDVVSTTSFNGLKIDASNNMVNLKWNQVENVKAYIIYRFKNNEEVDLNNKDNILEVIYSNGQEAYEYNDHNVQIGNQYKYFISVLDYANNEMFQDTQGINLVEEKDFNTIIILFSCISLLSIGFMGYVAIKVLKD